MGSTPEVSETGTTAPTFSCMGARPTEGCARVRECGPESRSPRPGMAFINRCFFITRNVYGVLIHALPSRDSSAEQLVLNPIPPYRSFSNPTFETCALCNQCSQLSPPPPPDVFNHPPLHVDHWGMGEAVLLMWPYIRSQIPTATLEVR